LISKVRLIGDNSPKPDSDGGDSGAAKAKGAGK
jgi:hypothetical protein